MLDRWYYWCGADVIGPISGSELAGLGAAGTVLPSDTVWKEGVEDGVRASRVKNLFPAAPATIPDAEPLATVEPVAVPIPQARKSRAVAGKGAVIVGQDGTTVRFRKICTTCRHEDSSWKSIAIVRGTTRTSFYCPKCRKKRDVEINGYVG